MVQIVTTKSVTFTTPVLDAKGKPLTQKIKWRKREVDAPVVEHHRHRAGEVIDVAEELAAELISNQHARMPDVALDDIVDPTKPKVDTKVDPLG